MGGHENGAKILVRNSGALSSLGASMKTAIDGQMPGEEKPFALLIHEGDRAELRAFIERMHDRRFGKLPILFADTRAEIEEGIVREPATLVIMRGETIAPVIQENIATGYYLHPRFFLILVKEDPGILCAENQPWSRAFRSKIARTFRWPTLPVRSLEEYAALFRLGVALVANELEMGIPSMSEEEERLVKNLPWDEKERDGRERFHVADILAHASRSVRMAIFLGEKYLTPELIRSTAPTIPPPVAKTTTATRFPS